MSTRSTRNPPVIYHNPPHVHQIHQKSTRSLPEIHHNWESTRNPPDPLDIFVVFELPQSSLVESTRNPLESTGSTGFQWLSEVESKELILAQDARALTQTIRINISQGDDAQKFEIHVLDVGAGEGPQIRMRETEEMSEGRRTQMCTRAQIWRQTLKRNSFR